MDTLFFGAQIVFYFIIIIHHLLPHHNASPPFHAPSHTPISPSPTHNSTLSTQSVEDPRPQLPYYILSLQWPPSRCFNHVPVACRTPIPSFFTIHGLWLFREPFPCVGEELTMNHLRDQRGLVQNMRMYWPNLLYSPQSFDSDFEFWERQWTVHGKCTVLHPLHYFAYAVREGRYYSNLLAETRRISPGNQPHNFDSLYQRLRAVIQTDFKIKCNRTPNAMHRQVVELRICFDRYMTPIPCFPPFNINCGLHQIFYSPLA